MTHILLEKAEQNRIIANYAASLGYYANSVSREYYKMYLIVTHYLTVSIPFPFSFHELRKADPNEKDERFKGPHGRLIREISTNAKVHLGEGCDEALALKGRMLEMRSLRNRAEYWPERTTQTDLEDMKRKSRAIEDIINNLCCRIESEA